MEERLEMILKKDQMERIQFGTQTVTVDLHGMRRAECCWLIKTLIASILVSFQMNLIHGYNHGTRLKEMIVEKNLSSRITEMHSDPWNPGVTHISIAGMC